MHVDSETLGTCLKRAGTVYSNRVFARDGDRILTFAAATDMVDRIAAELAKRGVVRGSRVALLLPNILEFPLVFLALAKLGALSVPIGMRYTGREIADLLRRSRAELLVTLETGGGAGSLAALMAAAPGGAGGAELPDLRMIWAIPDPATGVRLEPKQVSLTAVPAANIHDPVVVVYTSGTSGLPKGAVHSHAMLRNVTNMVRAFGITADDVILAHMPFNHVAGLCAAILPTLLTGCSMAIVRRWDADAVADLIERDGVTMFGGIPTHYTDLLEAVARGGQDMSSLRTAWIGGAAISPELARRALTTFGLDSLQAIYGMTETTSTTTLTPIGAPIQAVCDNKGKVIGDFEVAIFDPENNAPLPVGAQGEVRVRGHIVMLGYLDDPAATAEAILPDGWFQTGDLGRFDAEGYLAIEGRLKDVFRVGGSTVSPAEVERHFTALDGVRQAVVVGAPDARLGEIGFAFVQPEEGATLDRQVLRAALDVSLAGYKRPRFIHFVDEFPMTSTGKIMRQEMQLRAAEIVRAQETCAVA